MISQPDTVVVYCYIFLTVAYCCISITVSLSLQINKPPHPESLPSSSSSSESLPSSSSSSPYHRPSCHLRSSPASPTNFPHHRSDNNDHSPDAPSCLGAVVDRPRSIVLRRTTSSSCIIDIDNYWYVSIIFWIRNKFHVAGCSLYHQICMGFGRRVGTLWYYIGIREGWSARRGTNIRGLSAGRSDRRQHSHSFSRFGISTKPRRRPTGRQDHVVLFCFPMVCHNDTTC